VMSGGVVGGACCVIINVYVYVCVRVLVRVSDVRSGGWFVHAAL